ncbi:MAG: hypothetical protein HKN51_15425 [Saprospiraceae bacterium]|nr:hypothetical protein [Saprospiraceae bacterium]
MNFIKIITAICSILFLMIGADKFFAFLQPPCSLEDTISHIIWKVLGVMQLAAGFLIWHPKYYKYVAGFFLFFMLAFTIYHLTQSTYDIGGSASMAVMLGLILWNPSFLRGKN